MLKNYLTVAFRNLKRNKFYSIINIVGLSIGLISMILIFLFVRDELSYDLHHVNHERIYRLESHFIIQGKDDFFALNSLPFAQAMKDEYPEIEEIVRFREKGNTTFKIGEKQLTEGRVFLADSTVFNVFTYPLIYGDPNTALTKPFSIVITESMAKRFFGNENPMGKVLENGPGLNYTITGVMKDVPKTAHLQFNALCSLSSLLATGGPGRFDTGVPGNFWNIGYMAFMMVKEGTDPQIFLDRFPAFYDKYMKALGDQINSSYQLMLTPLADIHLHSKLDWDLPTGNIAYVRIFTLVGIFMMLIACINYMNMATARATKRAREVGIRKAVGGDRGSLIRQFLGESLLMTFIALIVAVITAELLLPVFNQLSGKSIEFNIFKDYMLTLDIIGLTILVGIVAGSYPAFYLSSFNPIQVLKSSTNSSKRGSALRKVLVFIQFTISVVMIIGTLVVLDQIHYLQSKPLGYSKDNIVYFSLQDSTVRKQVPNLEEAFKQNPHILGTGASNSIPGDETAKLVLFVESDDGYVEKPLDLFWVDYNYLPLLDYQLVEGRFFEEDMKTDQAGGVMINETLAKRYGWTEPIGKKISFGLNDDGTPAAETKVIGVIRDFNYRTLHSNIEPIVVLLGGENAINLSTMFVKISAENQRETIEYIQRTWEEMIPQYPCDCTFLEDSINQKYDAEKRLGRIFGYLAFLCIFIACMGLLGLSVFVAEQRTKEIGIRKVMGAEIHHIFFLMTREFMGLVAISTIFAMPISWYLLDKWLQSFAYRVQVGWIWLLSGAVIGLTIAFLTIAWQAFKAARSNPVNALQYE